MKQTELRLGNYITIHGCLQEIVELPLPENCTDENTKPIPLTEEWLLKFENIPWISKDKSGVFYWFNGEKKYIKFVHTLQNTYFCIEQKELLCKDTETLNI